MSWATARLLIYSLLNICICWTRSELSSELSEKIEQLVGDTYRHESALALKEQKVDKQEHKVLNPVTLTLAYDVVCIQILIIVIHVDQSK